MMPPDAVIIRAFGGLVATLHLPGGGALTRAAIWLPSRSRSQPVGAGAVVDIMPTLALRLEASDPALRGTVIELPPIDGGAPGRWIVRDIYAVDPPWWTVGLSRA